MHIQNSAPLGLLSAPPERNQRAAQGENPVRLRAFALAHRIFPLRTPVTGDAVSVCHFYGRREVIRIDSAFVFAAAYIVPCFGAVHPRNTPDQALKGEAPNGQGVTD